MHFVSFIARFENQFENYVKALLLDGQTMTRTLTNFLFRTIVFYLQNKNISVGVLSHMK